jgi:hypothetical protein
MQKQAFLFLCHHPTRATSTEFAKLKDGSDSFGDIYWLYHQREGGHTPRLIQSHSKYVFTDDSIKALGYPQIGESLIPGHVHFPVLQFYRSHPTYVHYWLIEYDVRYTGTWRSFFRAITEAFPHDFVASHLRRYDEEPEWQWWDSLSHPGSEIARSGRLRSFNPIFRVSNAGLQHLHEAHRDGWKGHNEVLFPTLFERSQLSIADFGGDGTFVPNGFQNRFYTSGVTNNQLRQGTMRYRPASWRPGRVKNMLHHPVKPLPTFLKMTLQEASFKVRRRLRRLRRAVPSLS